MTDEELEDTMCQSVRPWEEQWETLKMNESKVEEQEINDEEKGDGHWWEVRVPDPETSGDSAPYHNKRS